MHANALALSTWWIRLGNEEKSRRYRDIANEFLRGLQEVIIFHNFYKCFTAIEKKLPDLTENI